MKKRAYVEVTYPGLKRPIYFPYPEVQEFCLYLIDKDTIIYLTKEELRELEDKPRKTVK